MNYSLALEQKDLLILHKDMFKEETVFDTTTNMYQHVIQLRERVVGGLKGGHRIVRESMRKTQRIC